MSDADCAASEAPSTAMPQSAFLRDGASFTTIIDSIKVARQIFHRMKSYIQYRIALCLHLEIYLVLEGCMVIGYCNGRKIGKQCQEDDELDTDAFIENDSVSSSSSSWHCLPILRPLQ
jgi:hypothetical protein